jgi:hypothetical protein
MMNEILFGIIIGALCVGVLVIIRMLILRSSK